MLRYLSDPTAAALEKALQGQSLRQRTAANNIANVDTPGYRPGRVVFEDQLRVALANATENETAATVAIDGVEPTEEVEGAALRRDGNGVDIEQEMVELSSSTLQHHVLLRLLGKRMQMLRSVATEGGK